MITSFDFAWLALTYKCNNKCIWCYARSNDIINNDKNLNFNCLDHILSLLVKLGIKKLALIGGEPLLYPKIQSLISNLSRCFNSIYLITNGRRLCDDKFTLRLKANGLTHVGISIEGSSSSIHDSITQINGSFSQTINGIKNACSLGLKTYTNTTICKNNLNDLIKIVELLGNYSLYSINFNICGPCVSKDHECQITPTTAIKAYEKVYPLLKDKRIKSKLLTSVPICNIDSAKLKDMLKDRVVHGGPCQLVHGKSFVLDYNGDVIPCTHLTGFPMFNIFSDGGSIISSQDFLVEYNDPFKVPYQFRKKLRRYASAKCNRINCSENCSGGCPLFWTSFNPEKEIVGVK